MNLKKVQGADLKNKKVLLRVDFNVAVKDGKVQEKFKIAAAKETIDYLVSQEGVKIALLSHWGRPTFTEVTKFEKNHGGNSLPSSVACFSMKNLLADIQEILGRKISFAGDCLGKKVSRGLEELKPGELLLLENVRLRAGDEINDNDFSKELASNFDAFVNDAFSVCHRDQASVTGVAGILPSLSGIRLQKEIESLDKVRNNPDRPAVAIIGGAKIETKLPLIKFFEEKYDNVLVGGRIAVEAESAQIPFGPKVSTPSDYKDNKMDIGPETIKKFKEIISGAKTVVWNGPLGKFEESPYDEGTYKIISAVAESNAFSVIGGGETVQALEQKNLMDKISFVSTGGGAMLEYLSGNDLPGIETLKE